MMSYIIGWFLISNSKVFSRSLLASQKNKKRKLKVTINLDGE